MRITYFLMLLTVMLPALSYGEQPKPLQNRQSGPAFPVDTIGDYRITTRLESNPVDVRDTIHPSLLKGEIEITYNPAGEKLPHDSIPEITIDSFRVVFDGDNKFEHPALSRPSEPQPPDKSDKIEGIREIISPIAYPRHIEKLLFKYIVIISNNTGRTVRSFEHLLYRVVINKSYLWLTERHISNPFSPSTTISYIVPELSPVLIVIYDVKGQLVDTLINEVQAEGLYERQWEPDTLTAPGVYFYKITVGKATATKKMVLLR